MGNLLLIIAILTIAMSVILINAIKLNKKDKEEFEHYMHEHPEKHFMHGHGV